MKYVKMVCFFEFIGIFLLLFIKSIILCDLLLLISGIYLGYFIFDNKKPKQETKIGSIQLTGERHKAIVDIIQILTIEEIKSRIIKK